MHHNLAKLSGAAFDKKFATEMVKDHKKEIAEYRKAAKKQGDPVPAGYEIAAHQHPTAEAVTVISGAFHVGMGDKLDETLAEKLGPGGFVDLPANMNHFAFASVETVVQISSEGPFAIKYVNPSDDPSKAQ